MTMNHDPDTLAADLLDEVAQARKATPRPVPLLLRSPELMRLAPALRQQVLVHARRITAADPRAWLALVAYGACALALLFAAAPGQIGLLLAVGWLPALLLHTSHIRRVARRLARDLA